MKFRTLLFYLIFSACGLQAQNWIGLSQSNYHGANAFYFNTAMATSSPFMVSTNGLSLGMNFENNYLTYKMPFTITQWVRGKVPDQFRNSEGRVQFKNEWFIEDLNGDPKNFDLNIETRGPAFLYNFNRIFAVGVFSRTRIGLQGFGISEDLARIFRYGLDSTNNVIYDPPNQIKFGDEISDNSFSVNMNAFSEIGIGGAIAVLNNNHIKLSFGANAKYLLGMGTAYVKNNGTSFTVNGYDSISFGKSDFEYGYVKPDVFSKLNLINYFNGKPFGNGIGFDLSSYIELRKPKGKVGTLAKIRDVGYFFRGGISVQDIGVITYNQDVVARTIQNATPKTWVPGLEFAQAWYGGMSSGMQYIDSLSKTMFNITESDKIKTQLPTTLILHADLKVISKFFIGAQIIQSLQGRESVSFRKPSSITLVPRFEIKSFEISIPFAMYNDYQIATMGAFLRLGPFFIGTDNLVSSINRSEFNGFSYYFGLSHGFGNSKLKNNF